MKEVSLEARMTFNGYCSVIYGAIQCMWLNECRRKIVRSCHAKKYRIVFMLHVYQIIQFIIAFLTVVFDEKNSHKMYITFKKHMQ